MVNNADLFKRRYEIYGIFSKVLEGPIDDNLKSVFLGILSCVDNFAVNVGDNQLHNNIISIINYLQDVDSIELNRVYTSLFVSGGFGKIICPSVSMYLSSSGHIMAQERDDIMEIYSKSSFFLSDEFKEQEDHISAMLSYISLTCKDLSENNNLNNESIHFLIEFIKKYVINLLDKLIEEFYILDPELFYYYICNTIKTYIIYDFELDII